MILFSIFCDFQQILEVLKSTFLELVLFMHMYWDTIAKIKKTSNLFDNFWYQRKWFEIFWILYDIWVLKMGVCTQEATFNVFQDVVYVL